MVDVISVLNQEITLYVNVDSVVAINANKSKILLVYNVVLDLESLSYSRTNVLSNRKYILYPSIQSTKITRNLNIH